MTPYDAAYVALAEALAVVLVTADAILARAPGSHCAIELLRFGLITRSKPTRRERSGEFVVNTGLPRA